MYILHLKPHPLPHLFIYNTLSLTLMRKEGTIELEKERLREGIEGREGEEGEEHQYLSMDLNNTLRPLKLVVALPMENPSCMEKVMDGRACMMGLKEAWIEGGGIFNLLLLKLSNLRAKYIHLDLKVHPSSHEL